MHSQSDLGLHVQTETRLVGVDLLLQLALGHFQLCHLVGHLFLVHFLLMFPFNLAILGITIYDVNIYIIYNKNNKLVTTEKALEN